MESSSAVPPTPANGAPPTADAQSKPLFRSVIFHIVQSPKLPETKAREITALLTEGGGVESQPAISHEETTWINIDFQEVTHIIAADIDFPGYEEAEKLYIPIVKPSWVYAVIDSNRFQPVRPFNPDPRFFFSDVVATVAELPVGDKEAICGGIIAMGGQFSNHLTKLTTHLVALNMDNEKCRMAVAKRLKVKIVLPHWFDDCLKLNRRIDEKPYLLPNPDIQRLDDDAPVDLPHRPDLSYTHAHAQGDVSAGPPSVPTDGFDIFSHKRVMLGSNLELSNRLYKAVSELVTRCNGVVTQELDAAEVLICQFRDGTEYVHASRRCAIVGNLTWLYWMVAHRQWASPLRRLLHYPLVRGGMPEMHGNIITVSNYGGEARLYLESLIEALGAKFTKSMKSDNTHLITARAQSDKCQAAKEWNIHMVNHLWLEETYAHWKVKTLTDPKYTHFPRRTNLSEIIGQTQIDRSTLDQFLIEEDDESMDIDEPIPNPEPLPATIATNGTKKQPAVRTPVTRQPTGTPVPSKRARAISTDEPPPSTGSSRKAKQQAAERLHDQIMPDVALYQKEQKRKGGVVGGGRKRRSSASSMEGVLRGSKRPSGSPEAFSTSEDTKEAKKLKKRPKPVVLLLITGYKGWDNYPTKEDTEKKILLDIGIKCIQEPTQCTHLAAPHLVRTEKFCCALAKAPIVVTTKWVEACIKAESLLDTTDYLLQDPNGEKRLGVDLKASLSRAKQNRGNLLHGLVIYCLPGVHGGFDVCKRITEANGGICVGFKNGKRPANTPSSSKLVLLSGDDPGDRKLWSVFRKMAESAGLEYHIYKADWLLNLAMTQEISWSDKYVYKS